MNNNVDLKSFEVQRRVQRKLVVEISFYIFSNGCVETMQKPLLAWSFERELVEPNRRLGMTHGASDSPVGVEKQVGEVMSLVHSKMASTKRGAAQSSGRTLKQTAATMVL